VGRGTTLGVFLIAGAACGPSADDRRTADSVAAAVAQAKVATQAGEVLSSRHEAQPYFDAVRKAFVAKDRPVARKGLSDKEVHTLMATAARLKS
jgi:hypothetical protein